MGGYSQRHQQRSGSRQYSSGEQFDESHFSDFFENIFGRKSGSGYQGQPVSYNGQDINAQVQVTLQEAYYGTARKLALEKGQLQLKIKPGVKNGQVLKLKGKGGDGMNGATVGDLHIKINVSGKPGYKTKGDDRYCTIDVDLYTAILGGKSLLRTWFKELKVNIGKETDNGRVIRLKGMGMPVYNQESVFGDLYATINIMMPKNLTDEAIGLFRQLSVIKQASHADAI